MGGEFMAIALFVCLCLALMAGYPVAFTLGGISLLFAGIGIIFDLFEPSFLGALPSRLYGTMTNQTLMAVPLFVFMGVMLERSKIAEQLLLTMGKLFGNLRGGLGMSVIVVGALLATSTDGVGTKVAIAQAIDKHDTIGQDLVGMVVDDIVVVGAKPLFMTDYIACGKVFPERIADIVRGIAHGCAETGTALVGGETAEHPGLLGIGDYDVAGAATGVVEADRVLGYERVHSGDVVLALGSSGLHSNGFSLVRHIVARAGIQYGDNAADFGTTWGEALLEPTRLYTTPLLGLIDACCCGIRRCFWRFARYFFYEYSNDKL